MTQYTLSMRSRPDQRPDAAVEAHWRAWMERLGPSIVGGERLSRSQALGENADTLSTVLAAYLVIEAESFDDALAMAGGCPGLSYGGIVEVGEHRT